MDFEIRSGSRDDAPGIARVHVASWRSGYAGVVPDSVLHADDFDQTGAINKCDTRVTRRPQAV